MSDLPPELLDSVVMFWTCPLRAHAREPVEWRGGVAHCMAEGCEFTSEDTRPFVEAARMVIRRVRAEADEAKAELDRVRHAYGAELAEVDQILGKALGYPEYTADMFPDGVANGDVCTGEHTVPSLAAEAAGRIRDLTVSVFERGAAMAALEREVATLRAALADLVETVPCHSPGLDVASTGGPPVPTNERVDCGVCRPCLARRLAARPNY